MWVILYEKEATEEKYLNLDLCQVFKMKHEVNPPAPDEYELTVTVDGVEQSFIITAEQYAGIQRYLAQARLDVV